MQELYKVIIGLVAFIVFSWGMFGWVVKRWLVSTDDNIKELYTRTNNACNEIVAIKATCKERHKR